MVIFLFILWGLLVCFWAIVISSKEQLGSSRTIDAAQYFLPPFQFAWDLRRQETDQQTKPAYTNYLRKSSTQVLYPVT